MELYPSWRYHRTEKACIVDTPEADEALGEGWADTPAAFFEDPECIPSACSPLTPSETKGTKKRK